MNTELREKCIHTYHIWESLLIKLQDYLLLIMRLYWGSQFAQAGFGKLMNFDRTVHFFTTLGLPFPTLNVIMAGGTELLGGVFLFFGLGCRIITVPLIFTMCIAYLTAHSKELYSIFTAPDEFLGAPPFLYLLTSSIVLLFGGGKYALDYLILKQNKKY